MVDSELAEVCSQQRPQNIKPFRNHRDLEKVKNGECRVLSLLLAGGLGGKRGKEFSADTGADRRTMQLIRESCGFEEEGETFVFVADCS